jgi:hypothetical protein
MKSPACSAQTVQNYRHDYSRGLLEQAFAQETFSANPHDFPKVPISIKRDLFQFFRRGVMKDSPPPRM